MKAKTMRHAIEVRLFAVVLLATCAFAAAANAQTIAAKFTLPFETHWGKNERRVRSLNLPGRGVSLIYPPTTSAEREMLAKADQVHAVPVITAGK